MTFVRGDVTRLDPQGVGTGYDLFLDVACFHGLTPAGQARWAGRSRRWPLRTRRCSCSPSSSERPRPLPRGADASSIESALPGWRVVDTEPAVTDGMPAPLRKASPTWYRVSRTR